jgi:RHS repeat-associated protein
VNEVTYQPGMLEQWIHKYTYDADNRLSQASYTSNNADIELGANYLYYPHGPLRRLELGHKGIQGLDYAYTLQGWIKGLNSDILTLTNDMGGDSRAGSLNATFPRDVFGYSLHYNLNDYKAIDPDWGNSTVTDFLAKRGGDIDNSTNLRELYNGNIASWSQTLPNTNMWGPTSANEIGNNLRFVYQYDQLNRLLVARASDKMNAGNDWSAIAANLPTQLYKSSYGYDANGNILNAERWDQFQTRYDQFEYNYLTSGGKRLSNRLYRVKDQMPANVVDPSDPADQGVADIDDNGLLFNSDPVTINNGSNNYRYDPLGNLNQDKREQIAQIDWTVAGKVKSVTRTAGSTLAALTFGYGAHGHRIWKKNLQTGNTTFYIHDAQGNLMATYEAKPAVNSLALSERPIYGSDRLGMDMNKIELYGLPDIRFTNLPTNGPAGLRRYEIKDHLGNVCVTTTGDRYGVDQTPPDGIIDYTMPKVVSWSGYEPFGSLLPGRNYSSGSYRYLFQGQEHDDEINGAPGTSYAFEYRIHDPRVGRFLSIDPLAAEYPYNSPYAFAENKVIQFVELEGLECGQGASTPPQKPTDDPGAALVSAAKGVWDFFTSDDVPAQEKVNAVIPDKLGMLALKGISQLPQGKRMGLEVDLSGWGAGEWTEAGQEAIGLGAGAFVGSGAKAVGWRAPLKAPTKVPKPAPVQTPRGPALQAMTPEAIAARGPVQNGAVLYRQGSFGVQNTADAQFWSLTNPATTPNYVQSLGMPGSSSQGANWIMTGQVRAGSPFVVRPAPGIGANGGGALEVVTPPGGVQVQTFTMP